MSFLKYQEQNPSILNNYLRYKAYIEFQAITTVNEMNYDLITLFRYIKLFLYNKEQFFSINREEFQKITIKDVTVEDLNKVTKNELDNYIVFLSQVLNNEVKTRNRKIASVKTFFEYLETNNYINVNVAKNLEYGRIDKKIPKYLDLNNSKLLLAHTINSDCKFKIRNYAIICLFLNCGIRLSELTAINLSDLKIDNSEQTLKVHGKGNKERIVYLNEAACEAIFNYLKIRPNLPKNNKDYNALFISRSIQTNIKKNSTNNSKERIT